MSFCRKCGTELLENANACYKCGAMVDDATETTVSVMPKKKMPKFLIPLICGVVGVALVIVIFALSGKPYEKVAKEYLEAVISWNIAGTHETTIYNEEEYDIALIQNNEKISNVNEMYSLLSKEHFYWDKETNNYKDFYKEFTNYYQSVYAMDSVKIVSIESVEISENELSEVKSDISAVQSQYSSEYPLSEAGLIDVDKITKGYKVSAEIQFDGGESPENYDVYVVKYDGKWFVAYKMTFKDVMGEGFDKISVLRTKIADDVLKKALFSLERSVGWFSISYEDVLTKCTKNAKYEFISYEDGKNEYLSADEIAYFEEEYADGIENAYFAVVTGKIMYNPEIANYYTENKEIMCLLLWFNEEEQLTGYTTKNVCDEFGICASILCTQ